MAVSSYVDSLREICPQLTINVSERIAGHTYIGVGGAADIYTQPATMEEAQKIVKFADDEGIALTVLGYGTNVIIQDGGIRGIVMNLSRLDNIEVSGSQITAQAGASLIKVSHTARDCGLSGLEFACGIPGTVGGALIMNAGAYGGETSFVLTQAQALTPAGERLSLQQSDFLFGYRSSIFEREGYIVLEATFQLKPGSPQDIQAMMEHLTQLRQEKQPLEYPSCGSVFKRPPDHYAGKLIADSGLQGLRIGGAEVSTKHAGFIVNIGGATAADYLQLIQHIRERVMDKFGIELETEVKIIGEPVAGE